MSEVKEKPRTPQKHPGVPPPDKPKKIVISFGAVLAAGSVVVSLITKVSFVLIGIIAIILVLISPWIFGVYTYIVEQKRIGGEKSLENIRSFVEGYFGVFGLLPRRNESAEKDNPDTTDTKEKVGECIHTEQNVEESNDGNVNTDDPDAQMENE